MLVQPVCLAAMESGNHPFVAGTRRDSRRFWREREDDQGTIDNTGYDQCFGTAAGPCRVGIYGFLSGEKT